VAGRIAVGVIRKPHGVRGEASVESWTGSLDRFNELTAVTLVSPDESSMRGATIERSRAHAGRALVKFAEIESPEEIADLRGWTIEIDESEARPLEENEYFLHDLVGLTLVDAEGRERGKVVDTEEGAGGLLLNVERDGRRYDVPFVAEICIDVDLGQRRIVVNLPEGLDEI
jgi:16S rRNA processing protein RimM